MDARLKGKPEKERAGICAACVALALLAVNQAPIRGAPESFLYVGTYEGSGSEGVYAWHFDSSTGKASPMGLVAHAPNASFFAFSPNRDRFYAVREIGRYAGKSSGAIASFSVNPKDGSLRLINEIASGGAYPCYISVDSAGGLVGVSNYMGGSFGIYPIRQDGSLASASAFISLEGCGVNARRQESPHAHSINFSPDGRYVIVADLGTDRILVYFVDAQKGTLSLKGFARCAPGGGPRHLAFSRDGRSFYVLLEMASALSRYEFDPASGKLLERETLSTLPAGAKGENTAAEVCVHPSGRFIYCSNRGHDSVAAYALNSEGTLAWVECVPTGGHTPRNFSLDPTGRWLVVANQDSNSLTTFSVDQATGRLTPAGDTLGIGTPVCVRFLPLP